MLAEPSEVSTEDSICLTAARQLLRDFYFASLLTSTRIPIPGHGNLPVTLPRQAARRRRPYRYLISQLRICPPGIYAAKGQLLRLLVTSTPPAFTVVKVVFLKSMRFNKLAFEQNG